MGRPRFQFECAECGSGRLRLLGYEMLSVLICYSVPFDSTDADAEDWNVEYTLPQGGPRALVTCDKCRHEVKVMCRSEGGRAAVLWPAELYQMLWGALGVYGVHDESFRGKVEVDWDKFMARLVAARPKLSKANRGTDAGKR